jgi:hypothetical protein
MQTRVLCHRSIRNFLFVCNNHKLKHKKMTTLETVGTAAAVGLVAGASFAVGQSIGNFASECAARALASPAQAAFRGCDKMNLMYAGVFDEMGKLTDEEQLKALGYLYGRQSVTQLPFAHMPGNGVSAAIAA